jgi:NADH:ubiquinone oxidoreductase subunit D
MKWRIPKGDAYVRAESGRGEVGYYVASEEAYIPAELTSEVQLMYMPSLYLKVYYPVRILQTFRLL